MESVEVLIEEVNRVMDELGKGARPGCEAKTLVYLKRLKMALTGDTDRLESDIRQLKQFWLTSVPWCSTLSKDLAKILMMHEELSEQGPCNGSID